MEKLVPPPLEEGELVKTVNHSRDRKNAYAWKGRIASSHISLQGIYVLSADKTFATTRDTGDCHPRVVQKGRKGEREGGERMWGQMRERAALFEWTIRKLLCKVRCASLPTCTETTPSSLLKSLARPPPLRSHNCSTTLRASLPVVTVKRVENYFTHARSLSLSFSFHARTLFSRNKEICINPSGSMLTFRFCHLTLLIFTIII